MREFPRPTPLRLQRAPQGNCLTRAGVACTSQAYASQAPGCSAGELSDAAGVACISQAYAAQAPGCSAGELSDAGRGCLHFPGLRRSGSGSRALHKGADSAGPAFRVLPRPGSSGDPVLGALPLPRWGVSCPYPAPAAGFRLSSGSAVSGVPWVSWGAGLCGPPDGCQLSRPPGRPG